MKKWSLSFSSLLATATLLDAQCALLADGGGARTDADGSVDAVVVWDRDGAGPLPPLLVFGGAFRVIGDVPANAVAAYDPATGTWSALGQGMSGSVANELRVHDLAVAANGDLLATGNFRFADGAPVDNVARFDGTSWQAFGGGVDAGGRAVLGLANGDVVVAGTFQNAGGVAASRVARWDGSSWNAMGQGANNTVFALAVLANGDVVAGGQFDIFDGLPVPGAARWDGATRSAIGNGPGPGVLGLHVAGNGDLWAGGGFWLSSGGVANGLARWDGATWTGFGAGVNLPVRVIDSLANGDVVIGGAFFEIDGVLAQRAARWDGSSWSQLGGGAEGYVNDLAVTPSGSIVWTGDLDNVEVFDGAAVQPLVNGTDGVIHAAVALPGGDAVVVGPFDTIDGVACSRVARRSNGTWQAIGAGLSGTPRAVAAAPNGDLLVAEDVPPPPFWPGPNIGRVMRWDGASWSQLGTELEGYLRSLAVLPNGDVVVAGGAQAAVARWDGNTWTDLGLNALSIANFPVRVWTLPDGRLLASNAILPGGASLWDGVSWSPCPGNPGVVTAICVRPSGRIAFACNNAARVVEWDGAATFPLGGGANAWDGGVTAMFNLPNGDLLVGGQFTVADGAPAGRLARWNGAQWSGVGVELDGDVAALVRTGEQRILCVGEFSVVDGDVQAFATELGTSCPAALAATSSGCPSSGGANTLTADLPWIGADWTATATGLPSSAVALVVTGFSQTSVPLPTLLAQGVPGCSLDVTPDDVGVALVTGGETSSTFTLPANPQIVGVELFRQVVPIELGASGAFVAVTSTNALSVTIGAF